MAGLAGESNNEAVGAEQPPRTIPALIKVINLNIIVPEDLLDSGMPWAGEAPARGLVEAKRFVSRKSNTQHGRASTSASCRPRFAQKADLGGRRLGVREVPLTCSSALKVTEANDEARTWICGALLAWKIWQLMLQQAEPNRSFEPISSPHE